MLLLALRLLDSHAKNQKPTAVDFAFGNVHARDGDGIECSVGAETAAMRVAAASTRSGRSWRQWTATVLPERNASRCPRQLRTASREREVRDRNWKGPERDPLVGTL